MTDYEQAAASGPATLAWVSRQLETAERIVGPHRCSRLAASEETQQISEPWRRAGRTDLTIEAVEERLNAYLTSLLAIVS